MAKPQVQADSAGRNPVSAPNILELKINGSTPFLSHADAANDRLADAHAILLVMSQAFEGAHEAGFLSETRETIDHLSQRIVARALDAVSNLVAYAQYHIDCDGRGS